MGLIETMRARKSYLEAKIAELQRELQRVDDAIAAYENRAAREARHAREDSGPLPYGENLSTVEGMNTEGFSQSLRIAKGKAKDPLTKAAVRHRLTVGQAVEKVRKELGLKRLPQSGITQARRGTRPIRRDVADALERLIGFPATRTNWPGGFKDGTD